MFNVLIIMGILAFVLLLTTAYTGHGARSKKLSFPVKWHYNIAKFTVIITIIYIILVIFYIINL